MFGYDNKSLEIKIKEQDKLGYIPNITANRELEFIPITNLDKEIINGIKTYGLNGILPYTKDTFSNYRKIASLILYTQHK